MLEKTVHFLSLDLAGDTLRKDMPRYQKQQFVHVLLNNRSQKLRKIHSNALELLFSDINLQLY